MFYGATLTSEGENKFVVTFRDFPEIRAVDKTKEKALKQAKELLIEEIYIHFARTDKLPVRSSLELDDIKVSLPISLDAKIKLIQELRQLGVRNAELARLLGVSPQDIQRLFNLRHNTKIDYIADAFEAIGLKLEITLSA